jgi:carbamoyl-phosphate synthase small subunit
MKFGHHGCNNPVRDELTGRVAVTSQNHGFDVDEESLSGDTKVWFRNANDGTIEGIIDDGKRIYTSQFHPEAAPGPHDSLWIFQRFYDEMQRFEKESGGDV